MHDVAVVEAAQHVQDCICLTDIGQELVAQSFPLGGTLHQAGDVDDFNRRRDCPLGLADLCQDFQTPVRYIGGPDIRFDGTKREIGALGLTGADTIEQSGFADVGQSDDSAFE